MGSTKKVGSTGRFKGRYGVGVKKRVLAVERRMQAPVACTFCGFERIKREAAGLFICKKCKMKFTGGAYEPQTLIGKAITKMVSQKSFVEAMPELVKAKESSFSDIEREVEQALINDNIQKHAQEEPKERKRKGKAKKEESAEAEEVIEAGSEEGGEEAN